MSSIENKKTCFIVDSDNASIRIFLQACAEKGIYAQAFYDSKKVLSEIKKSIPDAVIIDYAMNFEMSPQPLSQMIRKHCPQIKLVIAGPNAAQAAIDSANSGAFEYLTKPVSKAKIAEILDAVIAENDNGEIIHHENGVYNLVGKSKKITETITIAKKVAKTDAPIMIIGPSGTGKELIAQLIHNHSSRSKNPFVKVNCGALNETLLQSELFGHEKGAFTGALEKRKGRFERANNGTLLLDEITETSLEFQAQLLRVLEQQTLERVGGEETIKINVRIICTTNKNVIEEINKGKFRQDLYYRLCGIRLATPALRERTEDIESLIWYFINKFSYETQRLIKKIDSKLLECFCNYDWPGNIRQLQNTVRTCLAFDEGDVLRIPEVSWFFDDFETDITGTAQTNQNLAGSSLQEIEKQAILATLEQTDGNQTKAAKLLGISGRTLRDKVKRYKCVELEPVC